MAAVETAVDHIFPEPLDIAEHREQWRAHVRPGYWDQPARRRMFAIPWHPGAAIDMLIHADHSVTTCPCCEPVIRDGVILGLHHKEAGDGAH